MGPTKYHWCGSPMEMLLVKSQNHSKPILRSSNSTMRSHEPKDKNEMKVPKVEDSLSWRKRKSHFVEAEGAEVSSDVERNASVIKRKMSANQLAAKAMRLRLKGKNEEADKLMEEVMVLNAKQGNEDHSVRPRTENPNQFLTQKERCLFCLENPNRPMHLVVSVANFTYLMLPRWQPVVPGHCCILPIHHESATTSVEDNVWAEIEKFKEYLIKMFAKQDKEVVFLETVMGLAQQWRHCMVECIPLPKDIAKTAPLYFKKAIDEAEDEWSQQNAKKVIDTSQMSLRNTIPKDFPYFYVEFGGLKQAFVHIIEDEKQFKSSFGLNVIRGMLNLSEDMYRHQRYETAEIQQQALARFSKEWNHFDWTKELHL